MTNLIEFKETFFIIIIFTDWISFEPDARMMSQG